MGGLEGHKIDKLIAAIKVLLKKEIVTFIFLLMSNFD
jgi:hypothetical protein